MAKITKALNMHIPRTHNNVSVGKKFNKGFSLITQILAHKSQFLKSPSKRFTANHIKREDVTIKFAFFDKILETESKHSSRNYSKMNKLLSEEILDNNQNELLLTSTTDKATFKKSSNNKTIGKKNKIKHQSIQKNILKHKNIAHKTSANVNQINNIITNTIKQPKTTIKITNAKLLKDSTLKHITNKALQRMTSIFNLNNET